MEDKNTIKLNSAADLPEVPRTEDGKIDLEVIAIGKTEKGFYIVPDNIMDKLYNELPAGTVNESKTWRAADHGKLKILGGDPVNDREIWKAGAATLNATNKQRRKLSETIDIFLKKKASIEELEELGLEDGATKQDALIAAMFRRAIEQKDVQAFNSLRDTAGEKPTDTINAEITQLTAEDREMLQRVQARLDSM